MMEAVGAARRAPCVDRARSVLTSPRFDNRAPVPRLGRAALGLQWRARMKIQINTDRNIQGHEALAARVEATVQHALTRFADQITRVEVHLSDENGPRHSRNDKRCMLEARLQGHQPLAVTHDAATLDEAVDEASGKLSRLIDHTLGRLGR